MQSKVDSQLSRLLVNLGLSFDEARCYLVLVKSGSLTAEAIGKQLEILPNAVYRLTKRLTKKGFVVSLGQYPTRFQAVPAEIAINSLTNNQFKWIEETKVKAIELVKSSGNDLPTSIEVLTGRKRMMEKYVELANKAKQEILIISIGEPVSDEIKLANRDALEKKITIRFLVHKYDKENENLLNNWLRMGIEVKHYPGWGFHLVVFDKKRSILATNNPKDTEERTTMVIQNEALSEALSNYFYSLWDKALPIK
jgi:sugar-specific transcriptional regulator TrmB